MVVEGAGGLAAAQGEGDGAAVGGRGGEAHPNRIAALNDGFFHPRIRCIDVEFGVAIPCNTRTTPSLTWGYAGGKGESAEGDGGPSADCLRAGGGQRSKRLSAAHQPNMEVEATVDVVGVAIAEAHAPRVVRIVGGGRTRPDIQRRRIGEHRAVDLGGVAAVFGDLLQLVHVSHAPGAAFQQVLAEAGPDAPGGLIREGFGQQAALCFGPRVPGFRLRIGGAALAMTECLAFDAALPHQPGGPVHGAGLAARHAENVVGIGVVAGGAVLRLCQQRQGAGAEHGEPARQALGHPEGRGERHGTVPVFLI